MRNSLSGISRTLRFVALLAVAALPACRAGADAPAIPESVSTLGDIALAPDTIRIRGLVPRNTTLETILRGEGLATVAVTQAIAAVREVFDPRRLRADHPFTIEKTDDGELRQFEYEVDADSILRVVATEDALEADLVPIPKRLEHGTAAGVIDEATPSLYQAMEATGESPELVMAFAQIFAGEIDFNNEVQPDDRFALAFERYVREDRPVVTYGNITAAQFYNQDRLIRAIRFTPPDGEPGYYDEQGRSLRRFFLRSPLRFDPRITSRFSTRRMHPILRTARAHNGVDYAAPTGAPVVAVSAARVISATYDNANGRMVRLQHAQGYQTYYLHLSRFEPGIRAGVRVSQGQVIGYVGSTGLATGPHLHYGLRKNGAWVDPLREQRNMPPGEPVPASAMAAFEQVRDDALAQLTEAMTEPTSPAVVTASQ